MTRQERQKAAYQKFVERGQTAMARNMSFFNSTTRDAAEVISGQKSTTPAMHQPAQPARLLGAAGSSSAKILLSMGGASSTQATAAPRSHQKASAGSSHGTNAFKILDPTYLDRPVADHLFDASGALLRSGGLESRAACHQRVSSQQQAQSAQSTAQGRPVGHRPSTTQTHSRALSHAHADCYANEQGAKPAGFSAYTGCEGAQEDASQRATRSHAKQLEAIKDLRRKKQGLVPKKPPQLLAAGVSPLRASSTAEYLGQSNASLLSVASLQKLDQYPAVDVRTGEGAHASRRLDEMIGEEERQADGFTMFSRGAHLRRGLIDARRVKAYLHQIRQHEELVNFAEDQSRERQAEQQVAPAEDASESSGSVGRVKMVPLPKVPAPIETRADPDLDFLGDEQLREKKQWRLMLGYFKKNPGALMDAIPTPRN